MTGASCIAAASSQSLPAVRGHYGLPELLFQAEDAVTGSGELAGLREGPGDVVAGVGGFRG